MILSYFQESLIILLVAPAILAVSSLLLASFSFPTLLLRGLAAWTVGYLAREDQLVMEAASHNKYQQEELAETNNQSPRFIF